MKRVDTLDALRGLAAVVVLLHHCSMVMPGVREAIVATRVLRPLVAGPQAVQVFFVLSGFALYRQLRSDERSSYAGFVVRRLARLYPPLVVALLASVMLYALVGANDVAAASKWFMHESWKTPPSAQLFLGHLALLDGLDHQHLDNVIWSLAPELQLSLLFPLVLPMVEKSPVGTLSGSLLVAIVIGGLPGPLPFKGTLDLLGSIAQLYLFVAGAVMALRSARLDELAAMPLARRLAPWAALMAVALICVVMMPSYAAAAGAVMLVVLCVASPLAHRALRHPMFAWLGRISYSLYLIHMPVLLALVHGTDGLVPTWLAVVLAIPLSLLCGDMLHRYVERDAIRWSRELGRRFGTRGADAGRWRLPMGASSQGTCR